MDPNRWLQNLTKGNDSPWNSENQTSLFTGRSLMLRYFSFVSEFFNLRSPSTIISTLFLLSTGSCDLYLPPGETFTQ